MGWLLWIGLLTPAVDEPPAPNVESTVLESAPQHSEGALTISEADRPTSRKDCPNCGKRVMPRLTPIRQPLPNSGAPRSTAPVASMLSAKNQIAIETAPQYSTMTPVRNSYTFQTGPESAQAAAVSTTTANPPKRAARGGLLNFLFARRSQPTVEGVPGYWAMSGTSLTSVQVVPAPIHFQMARTETVQPPPAVSEYVAPTYVAQSEAANSGQWHVATKASSENPRNVDLSANWRAARTPFPDALSSAVSSSSVENASHYEGRVYHTKVSGGAWMLESEGKSIALAPDRRLDRLKEGDRVRVEGALVEASSSQYLGAPLVQVGTLAVMDVAAAGDKSRR